MPLPTLAAQIGPTGISAPTYAEILQSLQESFQAIYGSDAYISPDSQDGQLLALFAQAIKDANDTAIATYNAFSPTFAQGVGLSSVVKINGIKRKLPSFSSADGTVSGQAGTVIRGGVVADANGNMWNLPLEVVIPGGGTILVTVSAQNPGAIVAPAGSISKINNPQLGWQGFVSTTDAVPGLPVETDAQLRQRQLAAASLPSQTPMQGMLAALSALPGVTRMLVYENTTGAPDANGLVAHSIAVVIEGGDVAAIAQVIGQKKTPGAALNGTTVQNYADPVTGVIYVIRFYVLAYTAVTVQITLKALTGWNTGIEDEIKAAVVAYINGLGIGQTVRLSRLYPVAYLPGNPDGAAFEITGLTINAAGADIVVPFDHAAKIGLADVTFVIAP